MELAREGASTGSSGDSGFRRNDGRGLGVSFEEVAVGAEMTRWYSCLNRRDCTSFWGAVRLESKKSKTSTLKDRESTFFDAAQTP